MNQNQIGRTVFDIDEETDAFYLQKAIEYHEWLLQQEAQPRLGRTPIFRDREDAERRLRADYFDDHCKYPLYYSPLFDDLLDDLAPVVPYVVNGVGYRNGYYLADGIYPEWASFIKSFTVSPRTLGTYSTTGPCIRSQHIT
nr:putative nuclease HARBI1 [Tanacetum cinerariifolium]